MSLQTPSSAGLLRGLYLAPRSDDATLLQNVREYVQSFRHDPLRVIRGFDATHDPGIAELQQFEAELLGTSTMTYSDSNVRLRRVMYPAVKIPAALAQMLWRRMDAYAISEYNVRVKRVAELYEFLLERAPPQDIAVQAGEAVSTMRPTHRCTLCNGPWIGGVSVARDLGHARPYQEEHVFHLTCALFLRATQVPCCPCSALPHRSAMCLACFAG